MDLRTCRLSQYANFNKKCITSVQLYSLYRDIDSFRCQYSNNNNYNPHREKNKKCRYSCKIKCSKNWEMAQLIPPVPVALPAPDSHWLDQSSSLPLLSASQPSLPLRESAAPSHSHRLLPHPSTPRDSFSISISCLCCRILVPVQHFFS